MAKISRAERKMAMRQQASRKVRGAGMDPKSQRKYGQDVEKGRTQLLRQSSEGGDALAKRVKSELNYLLNNYMPRYDARIEQLIDQWRRSGDPEYSPSIRSRLLQARRQHSKTPPI